MRDSKAPGLRVRATTATAKNPNGVKAFVFEAKLNRQTIRRTIGDVRAWTIDAARIEASAHYQDHLIKAAPGGAAPKRGTTLTVPGPLAPLMALPLRSLDVATVEAWATKARPTRQRACPGGC